MATAGSPQTPPGPGLLAAWPRAHLDVLSNGLRVVHVPLPHLHTAAVTLYVRVGSRYETPQESGLSHVLEHLLFRGCAAYPAVVSFNEAIETCATGLGASTYRDFGMYDATCAPARVPELLALLGAMLEAPRLSAADLEIERQVILEEIADDVDERGRDVDVDNIAKRGLFGDRGLGLKVGGRPSVVRRLGAADCRAWYERHYGARNMVLVVAGPVPRADAVAWADATLGHLAPGELRRPAAPVTRTKLPALEYVDDAGNQSGVQLSWVVPGEEHEDWPALLLAHRALDDGTSARLRRRIVDEEGLAYHVSADLETYEGVGLFQIDLTLSNGNVLRAVDVTLGLLADLAASPLRDAEWRRLRGRYGFELSASVDSAPAVASWFGLQQLHEPHHGLAERYERVMAVGRDDLGPALRRHLSPSRLQLTVVGSLEPVARAGLRRRLHRLRGA